MQRLQKSYKINKINSTIMINFCWKKPVSQPVKIKVMLKTKFRLKPVLSQLCHVVQNWCWNLRYLVHCTPALLETYSLNIIGIWKAAFWAYLLNQVYIKLLLLLTYWTLFVEPLSKLMKFFHFVTKGP